MGEQAKTVPEVQKARARQYVLCTIALDYDEINLGAEGIFDQALTNGLAAIVAYNWPGQEMNGPKVRSAAGLLGVIERRARKVSDGVYYVSDQRDADPEPEFWTIDIVDDDESMPKEHTVVKAGVLRAAIDATQAIRHARAADKDTTVTLSKEQIYALHDLSFHPMLSALPDVLGNRYVQGIDATDRAATRRALQYIELLDEEELNRRAATDYSETYSSVDECPVCENESLVVQGRDGWIDEVAIGQCVVCSYERTSDVADDIAQGIQIERAIEHSD